MMSPIKLLEHYFNSKTIGRLAYLSCLQNHNSKKLFPVQQGLEWTFYSGNTAVTFLHTLLIT